MSYLTSEAAVHKAILEYAGDHGLLSGHTPPGTIKLEEEPVLIYEETAKRLLSRKVYKTGRKTWSAKVRYLGSLEHHSENKFTLRMTVGGHLTEESVHDLLAGVLVRLNKKGCAPHILLKLTFDDSDWRQYTITSNEEVPRYE